MSNRPSAFQRRAELGEGGEAKRLVQPGLSGRLGLLEGSVDTGYVRLGAVLVGLVGEGEPGHDASNRAAI